MAAWQLDRSFADGEPVSLYAQLMPKTRDCCICGCSQLANDSGRHFSADSAVLSLNVTIYRPIPRGQQLATTKRVRICESCLAKVCAGDPDVMILAGALATALADTFRAMIDTGKGTKLNKRAAARYSNSVGVA